MDVQLDPAAAPPDIEKRSFEIIDAEVPEPRPFAGNLWQVARRCVHAMGDIGIVHDLQLSELALESGLLAMRKKCVIYTDTRMLAAGLVKRRMQPLGIEVIPVMELPGLEREAASRGITRSRRGMERIAAQASGQIVAIGNAPTALLALLEALEAGGQKPALIVGMPVGFVNAVQSKEILAQSPYPFFTLHGRKGGSAVAAACVNAMAEIVLAEACG